MEEMPRKSAAGLEAECLRLLAMDPHTLGITRVEIIRMYPTALRARQPTAAGVRYAVVYKANRDQIRNPNRIYPGQIFVLHVKSARAGRPESLTATRWKFMGRVPRLWEIDAPESSQLRRGGR
jgi:hypothetical protein